MAKIHGLPYIEEATRISSRIYLFFFVIQSIRIFANNKGFQRVINVHSIVKLVKYVFFTSYIITLQHNSARTMYMKSLSLYQHIACKSSIKYCDLFTALIENTLFFRCVE